jgi:G:T-mismatch repair DNA endonuclease (very short patch repair protein)
VSPVNELGSFQELAPQELLESWDSSKNTILPSQVTLGSGVAVWWKCNVNHSWKEIVNNRRRVGCPYCSNRKTLIGFNDLCTTHSNLLSKWDYHLNKNLGSPEAFRVVQEVGAWWKCDQENHSFLAPICKIAQGCYKICPYCSNRRLLVGFNDIVTATQGKVMKEWAGCNYHLPHQVCRGELTEYYFTCSQCGEEYQRSAREWSKGYHCPQCAKRDLGRKIRSTRSRKRKELSLTLKDANPELALEWDYARNSNDPEEFSPQSNSKAHWVCNSNHSYRALISNRAKGSGCPKCFSASFVSKGEIEVADFLKAQGFAIQTQVRSLIHRREIDVLIPSRKVAIEFNGDFWHSQKAFDSYKKESATHYHQDKFNQCKEKDYLLLFVWEDDWTQRREKCKIELLAAIEAGSANRMLQRINSRLDNQKALFAK